MRVILASTSPRRQDLLRSIDVDFEVIPADIDESALAGESPEALVKRLSAQKAAVVADNYPDALVIAADTIVTVDGEVLAKPVNAEQNHDFIRRLSGNSHQVHTGHALRLGKRSLLKVVRSDVRFRSLSEAEIDWYVSTGEGLDKAGGYAIQGYGATIVKEICGCYFNIVGLSLANVIEAAKSLGVELV